MGFHIQMVLFLLSFSILSFSFSLYLIFLLRKKNEWWEGATTAGLVGTISLASGIFLRLLFARRIIFSSTFEASLLLSLTIIIIHFVLERHYELRVGGVILLPIALFFLGLALILPEKTISHIPPTLNSHWFFLHSICGVIGYGFFSIGLGLLLLYLLKTRTPLSSIGLWLTGGVALTYFLLDSGSILRGSYHLNRMILHQIGDEKRFTSARNVFNLFLREGYSREELSDLLPLKIHIPFVGKVFLISLCLISISFVLYLIYFFQKEQKLEKKALFFARIALPFQVIGLALLIYQIPQIPEVYFASNPFEFSSIVSSVFLSIFFVFLSFSYHSISENLPEENLLSEVSLNMIESGFLLYTLSLIFAGIWRNEAFGNYWLNTPSEWWPVIGWFLFLLSLHLWKEERKRIGFAFLGLAVLLYTLFGLGIFSAQG